MVKKALFCCFLLLCLYLFPMAAQAGAITVTVAGEAVVRGPLITLGELAEIAGADPDTLSHMEQLTLGSAPPPGGSLVLTDKLLTMRLASADARYGDIVWQVPAKIKVTTGSQKLSGAMLAAAAIEAIKDKIGQSLNEADLSIVPAVPAPDVTLPQGDVFLTVDLPYGIRYTTPTVARINIMLDHQLYNRRNVSFDVKYFQSVVVADRLIDKNQILLPQDLRYERMDASKLSPGYFTDIGRVAGLMVRRSLTPGAIVNNRSLEKPVVVKRGNHVTILARVGEIEVRTAGQAMQDGGAGDMIRVQNFVSKKILSARVLDAITVQVDTI